MASLTAVSCLFFQAAVLQFLLVAEASHFRYGTISWAPVDSFSNTLRFTFRLAFRRSFSSSYYCDQSTIGSGSLRGSGGSWRAKCNYCSSTTIASTGFHCTDYSSNEDWSVGENNFNYTFSSYDRWVVSYSSCCWISLSRYGNGAWFISTTVNLTRRSDNGRINSSPVSRSPAIVRWSEGCPSQSLRIPVEDADGDVVKCRYAKYSESYFYNDSFPYATLDEKTCLLTYNGNYGTAGTYAVALTIEDFPAGTTNFDSITPFSAVGLQFLVIISSHSGSCNNVPVFTPSTPNDGECTEVQTGSLYRVVIEATLADYSKSVVEIVTSSPPGMQFTSLSFHGGVYYRNVTWYPNQYQVGQQSFCFKAVDSSGMGTEWRCVTILVGISSTPRVVWGSQTPQSPPSNNGPGYVWWSIQFDRVIKKPRTSSFIRLVLLPSGHTVYKVDTLSQFAIINSDLTTLWFAMPDAALSMNGSYAILMDRGAVVGQGCSYDGPPTPGITNTSDWQFTAGVCPVGYTLAPPDFSNCVDINECGSPSRSKRSFYWWGYTTSSSTQWLTTVISPSTSSSYVPFTASFPGSCSRHIYSYLYSYGYLYSPGYPGCYADNLMCTWLIEAPSGYYVYLHFNHLNLEYCGSSCFCDYVEIRDGSTLSSPLITKACGSLGYFYVYSSGRFLLLRFRTDGSVQGTGFEVYYSTVNYWGSNWIPSHQVSSTSLVACVPSQTFRVTRISTTLPITPTTSSSYIPSTMSYSDHEVIGLNNSVIVGNNSDSLSNLTYWLRPVMRNGTDWKLCWRASRDGWNANTFHSLCDEKGPTITIIKVGKYIFGGYTSLPWPNSTYCRYGYDSEAFLFSLVNGPGWAPVKLNQSAYYSRRQYSIYSCSSYGPTFGGGHDMYIANNAAYSSSSYSYLYTYSPPSGYSSGSSSFLAGSYSFTPDEIETFFYKTFVPPVIGLNNSVIVGNNSEYLSNLTNWIKPRKSESDWKLCWRASRDGWDSSRFHSLCDKKGPTVTIVKVGKYIFGGYTSLSWSSGCLYQYDAQAFLFSLVNMPGWAPVKFNQTGWYSYYKSYSTYSCYSYGPTFGGGHDLRIGRYPYNHYSNLGYTYSPPSGYSYGSSFAQSFLAGSYQFNPDEVETFYDANFTSQASTRTISPSYTASPTASLRLSPSVSATAAVSPSTSPSVSSNVPILSSECSNHTYLEDYRRAQGFYNGPSGYYQCDNNLPFGWYRFRGPAGTQMASTCIGVNRCGSHGPGWLSTQHPFVSDGIVNGTACFHWGGSCCLWSINVRVRNCSGFYVYELRPTTSCHYRYCGDGEAASYSLSSSTGVRASQITPSSSSGHYAPSSSYALPAPVDFQFHVPSDCEQICTNTPGSYRCSCVSGYQLSSDGKSCVDIDECLTNNGGCSHHCYNIPGSFYCGCPEGTTMASNNLTCVEPGVSVACDENNMTVSLEKQTFPFFNVSSLHLRYSSCRATENSTHFLISTPLNSCGTLVNETEDALIFWNEIRADAVIIDNVITRTHDIKFKFYCSYSRRKMLSIQFQPQHIFFGSEAGYGNFTFKMDFYKTAAFATPYTENDYPILVALNEFLYVKYSVESSASNQLVIMAENCKATRYGSFYSWPYYTIIQNGCERDTSMEYTYNPLASFQKLKIRSFRFFNDYDVVYFHCELLACYKGNSNSRCSRGCLSSKRRKRRGAVDDEIEHEESTSTHILSSGPIMIKETETETETEEPDEGDTGKSQQTALIGGAAAAGGLSLIVIIALAVLAVKYRIARRFMNRNKVGDLYTTQDEQMSRRNAYIQEDDMIEREDSF